MFFLHAKETYTIPLLISHSRSYLDDTKFSLQSWSFFFLKNKTAKSLMAANLLVLKTMVLLTAKFSEYM